MRLTREQLLIAYLRIIGGRCVVDVCVQEGRPTRFACTGPLIDREYQVEIPETVDACSRELSANERHLLGLCEEVCFGKVRVTLDGSRIVDAVVVEWLRKLEDVDLPSENRSLAKFMRSLMPIRAEVDGRSFE